MAGRRPLWRKLVPYEVRRASLWALAGLVAAFVVAALLPADWRLAKVVADAIGKMVAVWQFTRINVGAPGWGVGLPGEYDERETAERHQALATAYIIVVLLVGGVLVAGGVARMLDVVLPEPKLQRTDWILLAVFGLTALPGIVLAWRSRRFELLDSN